MGSKEVIRGDGREIHHWVAYDGTRGALPTYHLLGCSSRQNFLHPKIKNVFLFVLSQKSVCRHILSFEREMPPRGAATTTILRITRTTTQKTFVASQTFTASRGKRRSRKASRVSALMSPNPGKRVSQAKKRYVRNPNLPFVSRELFTKARLTDDEEKQLSTESYEEVLKAKANTIEGLLRPFYDGGDEDEKKKKTKSRIEFEVFASPKLKHFRQRVRFGICEQQQHREQQLLSEEEEKGKFDYCIFERSEITRIETKFDIASESLQAIMNKLREALNEDDRFQSLREGRLSAVTFHENRKSTECVVTLWRGEPFREDFAKVSGLLAKEIGVKAIVGRTKGDRRVSNDSTEDFVVEEIEIKDNESGTGRVLRYKQPEGSFSNPNGDIAEMTANWLCRAMETDEIAAQTARSFVELYCGNMNHGCYLAKYFPRGKVIGVERDENLCRAAEVNLEMNSIENGTIINAPAEIVARRFLSRLRKKKRGEENIEGEEYPFTEKDFLLVDPPRAGLDEITLDLAREFKDIIYISCDARSLARDLGEKKLSETHRVKRLAAFDHFPWHADFLEVVCQLEKKE